jgi:hypothetical protein
MVRSALPVIACRRLSLVGAVLQLVKLEPSKIFTSLVILITIETTV